MCGLCPIKRIPSIVERGGFCTSRMIAGVHSRNTQPRARNVVERFVQIPEEEVATAIITYKEQLRGRLSVIRRASIRGQLAIAYQSFSLESMQALLVSGEFFREDLDGDIPTEFRVSRSVNFTHPARTDGLDDVVVAESGARLKGHG